MSRPPNLAITITLYVVGFLLVTLAIVLLLKAFGVFQTLPDAAIWGLVLLAIGLGILTGLKSRTY